MLDRMDVTPPHPVCITKVYQVRFTIMTTLAGGVVTHLFKCRIFKIVNNKGCVLLSVRSQISRQPYTLSFFCKFFFENNVSFHLGYALICIVLSLKIPMKNIEVCRYNVLKKKKLKGCGYLCKARLALFMQNHLNNM